MRPISETAGEELLWIQPAALRREHELRAGDDVVATLRFQRGSLADAEAEGRHWTFKRQGFWQPRVTVRVPGSDADVAAFRPHWAGGGTLDFADGASVRLSSANFWQSQWVWQEKDQPLILFKGRYGIVKAKGAVEILPGAESRPDTPLLVLLGWYLILLHADDADAAAGSSAAAVAATSG
ncbi:MAG TPA: hypothetical protein VJT14_01885 [Candidatus Dormibacteraeota bacterium]|nr:hypothetical protein [Candidatus Dormibacteraeota bacterium]